MKHMTQLTKNVVLDAVSIKYLMVSYVFVRMVITLYREGVVNVLEI